VGSLTLRALPARCRRRCGAGATHGAGCNRAARQRQAAGGPQRAACGRPDGNQAARSGCCASCRAAGRRRGGGGGRGGPGWVCCPPAFVTRFRGRGSFTDNEVGTSARRCLTLGVLRPRVWWPLPAARAHTHCFWYICLSLHPLLPACWCAWVCAER